MREAIRDHTSGTVINVRQENMCAGVFLRVMRNVHGHLEQPLVNYV